MKTALALALLILPLAAAPIAEARKAPAHPQADATLSVSRADLDLTQPGDAAVLLSRAETIAHAWCVEPDHQLTTTSSCVRRIMADMVARVNEPAVTTAWTSRNDHPILFASR